MLVDSVRFRLILGKKSHPTNLIQVIQLMGSLIFEMKVVRSVRFISRVVSKALRYQTTPSLT